MTETADELVRQFGAKATQQVVDRIVAAVRDNDYVRMNGLNRLLYDVERKLASLAEAQRYRSTRAPSDQSGVILRT